MNCIKKDQVIERSRAGARSLEGRAAAVANDNPKQVASEVCNAILEVHSSGVSQEKSPLPKLRSPGRAKRIFPIALMVEGRQCLVVGGGNVAARKAEALLEVGAKVTIVAPEIGERARALRSVQGLRVVPRKYVPEDLNRNLFLVIAATNDYALNQTILEACRSRGILCSCPDRGWENGDFISPASFKHGDLTVSVSTGGAACRRSRLIRDYLAKQVKALAQIDLLVLGTDHRFAALEERESLHLSGDRLEQTGAILDQMLGLHEFMLLHTCNRIELIGVATMATRVVGAAKRILGLDRIGDHSYTHWGIDAFRHLAFIAAGLLSQTPRETHIRAQIKKALDQSRRNGWAGGIMYDWVGRALRLGTEIRNRTGNILEETEIEERCISFLADALGELRNRRLLVIGSGTVGRSIVKALLKRGSVVSCCYHTHAPEITRSSGREIHMWSIRDLGKALRGQDAVVCAVAGTEPVLRAEHSSLLTDDQPLVLVDLGVPRNIAPDFSAGRNHIRVVNLDDLNQWDRRNEGCLGQALEVGYRVINEHFEEYERVVLGIHNGD